VPPRRLKMTERSKKILRGIGIVLIGGGSASFILGGGNASIVNGIVTAVGAIVAVIASVLEE
jgi:hypothetical protein